MLCQCHSAVTPLAVILALKLYAQTHLQPSHHTASMVPYCGDRRIDRLGGPSGGPGRLWLLSPSQSSSRPELSEFPPSPLTLPSNHIELIIPSHPKPHPSPGAAEKLDILQSSTDTSSHKKVKVPHPTAGPPLTSSFSFSLHFG